MSNYRTVRIVVGMSVEAEVKLSVAEIAEVMFEALVDWEDMPGVIFSVDTAEAPA